MARILLFFFLFAGLAYIIFQINQLFNYKKSLFFRIDEDLMKLRDEMNLYRAKAKDLKSKQRALRASYMKIKFPPADVQELYELRYTLIEKEVKLYNKIISLYEKYHEILKDKAEVMRFKAKHGSDAEPTEEVSDALFKVEHLLNDLRTNFKISYYDQIVEGNELTDLKGSLKHLQEMESNIKIHEMDEGSHEKLELNIQDDILKLKELVRKQL